MNERQRTLIETLTDLLHDLIKSDKKLLAVVRAMAVSNGTSYLVKLYTDDGENLVFGDGKNISDKLREGLNGHANIPSESGLQIQVIKKGNSTLPPL